MQRELDVDAPLLATDRLARGPERKTRYLELRRRARAIIDTTGRLLHSTRCLLAFAIVGCSDCVGKQVSYSPAAVVRVLRGTERRSGGVLEVSNRVHRGHHGVRCGRGVSVFRNAVQAWLNRRQHVA